MNTKKWNLQVNTRSGYIDSEEPVKPLPHQVNQIPNADEDEELLLPVGIALKED